MPTAAEQLSPGAGENDAKAAISKCIAQMVGEGKDQDQAAAICYSQAQKSSGVQFGVQKKSGAKRTTGGMEE